MRECSTRSFTPWKVGDKVWLEATNLRLQYPSRKLSPKRQGPFEITQVLSPLTYRLQLPSTWRIHNVFHTTLLSPYKETATHGPNFLSPPPVMIGSEEEYEVDKIVSHKGLPGWWKYLTAWKGYPSLENTWEPKSNLRHTKQLLMEYKTAHHINSLYTCPSSLCLMPPPNTFNQQTSPGSSDSWFTSSSFSTSITSHSNMQKSTPASAPRTPVPSTIEPRKRCLFVSTPLVDETQPCTPYLLHHDLVPLDLEHHLLLHSSKETTPSKFIISTCESTCLTPSNMSSPPSISFSSLSASSPSSTNLSFLCSTPVYPCLLPASITLTLYVAVITNTPALYAIERLPFYESNAISQELVRLLLDTFRFRLHYNHTVQILDQALLLLNGDLLQRTLNALHLHGFHTYLEHLEPELLLPVFLPIYQSLSLADQEQYQTITTLVPNKPQIEVMLTPLPVPLPQSPSTLPISLASHISSQPVSPSETLMPESGFSQENALLTASFVAHSPQGRQIMASPTQTLPHVYQPLPATPSTRCFLCHNLSHYRENCPSYQCPHCLEKAPGHPSHLCMWTRCTFCQRWGHSDRVCPQRLCRDCDQPGHLSDDCPFTNLSLEQANHIFGDGSPLWQATTGVDRTRARSSSVWEG